ncbi:ABC transporter permease [Rhizobium binxianense]
MSAVSDMSAAPVRRWTAFGLFGKGLFLAYLALMLVWLLFPIVLVLLASFQGKLEVSLSLSDMGLDAYKAIPPAYWEAFWFTVRSAISATLLALLVAVPAAWGMVRGRLKGRRLFSNLVLIPDVVPQLILGIALLTVFIPLRLSNSFAGVLLALTALSLSTGLRFTEALLSGLPEEYEQAANTLGANRLTTFRLVTLPLIAPGLAIAALFIFMQNLVTFELLYFIAGPNASPVSVRLFSDIVDRGVLPYAVAMAGILIYVAIAFYTIVAIALGPKYMAGSVMSRKG